MKFFEYHGHEIIVDDEDYPLLSRFSWSVVSTPHGNTSYAITSAFFGKERKSFHMHRLIMGLSGRFVDHINGNGLDNRKENLRLCSHSQNMINWRRANKTGMRGVNVTQGRIYARIKDGKGNKISLGRFPTIEDAAHAYDKAALEFHGEFAFVNFPENKEAWIKARAFLARSRK